MYNYNIIICHNIQHQSVLYIFSIFWKIELLDNVLESYNILRFIWLHRCDEIFTHARFSAPLLQPNILGGSLVLGRSLLRGLFTASLDSYWCLSLFPYNDK